MTLYSSPLVLLKMRILNVNSTIDLKSGGGTAERTVQMSRAMVDAGQQCSILTLDININSTRIRSMEAIDVILLPCLWKRFYVPKLVWGRVKRLVQASDIVHLMGHWSILNVLVFIAAIRTSTPYVVCPAGALGVFGRSALLKRAYNILVGNSIIRRARACVAITRAEFRNFEDYGVPVKRVTVIPNGVNDPKCMSLQEAQFFDEKTNSLLQRKFLLFMGRLNLIKGPDMLLDAFIQVAEQIPSYHLVFAGPDNGMLEKLKIKSEVCGLTHRVHFLGHIEGGIKNAFYSSTDLLIVPSRQEAMSIVALEAGIRGKPVLVTDQCGFEDLLEVSQNLIVPATVVGLAEGILTLVQDRRRLKMIGDELMILIRDRFTWPELASNYLSLYKDIIKPD